MKKKNRGREWCVWQWCVHGKKVRVRVWQRGVCVGWQGGVRAGARGACVR